MPKVIRVIGCIPVGETKPETMYLSLTDFGKEVSNRVAIEVIVGQPSLIRIGFADELLFNGVSFYQGYRRKEPFRTNELRPIRANKDMILELSYTLAEFESLDKLDFQTNPDDEPNRRSRYGRDPVI
jgi:hypothetical protein